jgi:uncharacterized membrane protein
MTNLFDTLQRIPSQFVAVFVAAAAAWVFLRLLRDEALQKRLFPVLGEFVVVYMVATRFSGLLLHPSEFVHFSIWNLLADAPSSGWLFGLVVAAVVVYWQLRRRGPITSHQLFGLTNTVLFSAGIWLIVRTFVDRAGFLERDIAILAATAVLLVLSLRNAAEFGPYAHRLWIFLAVVVLLASTRTPYIDKLGPFTPLQWLGVMLLGAGLLGEVFSDARKRTGIHLTGETGNQEDSEEENSR